MMVNMHDIELQFCCPVYKVQSTRVHQKYVHVSYFYGQQYQKDGIIYEDMMS